MPRPYKQRAVVPLADRLFPRIDAGGDCWLWIGALQREGYGAINLGRPRRVARVHRVVWELLVGPIPDGLTLDHLCRVRRCCNPDHLEPVTLAENVARGSRRAGLARQAKCRRAGHPLTPENLAPNGRGRGRGICRECKNEANRRYRERKAAA